MKKDLGLKMRPIKEMTKEQILNTAKAAEADFQIKPLHNYELTEEQRLATLEVLKSDIRNQD